MGLLALVMMRGGRKDQLARGAVGKDDHAASPELNQEFQAIAAPQEASRLAFNATAVCAQVNFS